MLPVLVSIKYLQKHIRNAHVLTVDKPKYDKQTLRRARRTLIQALRMYTHRSGHTAAVGIHNIIVKITLSPSTQLTIVVADNSEHSRTN